MPAGWCYVRACSGADVWLVRAFNMKTGNVGTAIPYAMPFNIDSTVQQNPIRNPAGTDR